MENEPSKVQVLDQLERIVSSSDFAASPRKRKFLRYVVEKTLNGEASTLKGYAIGVDVFERGDDFDPQADTIVRVQARNLRKALELYYLTIGKNDPLLIELKKGGYKPKFLFPDTVRPTEAVPGVKQSETQREIKTRQLEYPSWWKPVLIFTLIGLAISVGLLLIRT